MLSRLSDLVVEVAETYLSRRLVGAKVRNGKRGRSKVPIFRNMKTCASYFPKSGGSEDTPLRRTRKSQRRVVDYFRKLSRAPMIDDGLGIWH